MHHLTAAFRALSGFPGMSNVAKTGAEEATAAWMSSGCFNLDLGPKVTFQMVGTGAMRFSSQQPVAVLTGDFRTPAIFSVLSYTLNTPAAGNGQSADLWSKKLTQKLCQAVHTVKHNRIPSHFMIWSIFINIIAGEIYGYGSIPIDTFLVGWTSIYQLFWGSLGTRVLTHPHISIWSHHLVSSSSHQ